MCRIFIKVPAREESCQTRHEHPGHRHHSVPYGHLLTARLPELDGRRATGDVARGASGRAVPGLALMVEEPSESPTMKVISHVEPPTQRGRGLKSHRKTMQHQSFIIRTNAALTGVAVIPWAMTLMITLTKAW